MKTIDGAVTTLAAQDRSFSYIRGQVAKILLEHAGDGNGRQNKLAHRDMANMLGTGWDVIYLSLKSLYHEGIIRIERDHIIVNKKLVQEAVEAAPSTSC